MNWLLFVLSLSSVFSSSVAYAKNRLCKNISLEEGKLKLNENEKVLVCGNGPSNQGWDEVPLTQAELHLRTILNNLGYLNPRFERTEEGLKVWSGPRTRIKTLHIEGAEHILNPKRKRKVIGEPLVPAKLDEIKAWANVETHSRSYACADNTITAHAWDGSVWVHSELGERKEFAEIRVGDLGGLRNEVLDRYQPFETGDWYDIRKTQLMTSRMLTDGLFQSAYFITHCEGHLALLDLETSIGKPKILRIGIGASTEEFPFLDISFRNARLDDMASSYTANLHASPRLVSLSLSSELYIIPGWHQFFAGPRLRLAQENERAYQVNSARLGIDIGRNWDIWNLRFNGRWGPTLNYSKTLRGIGPEDITYPTIEASLLVMNHIYEYLIREQYEGWLFNFYYRGQNQGLGSQVDVNRYKSDLKILWNLGNLAPPHFVLGTRIESTIVDARGINQNQNRDFLPIEDRIFMGGDQDLRGFPRQSLDNQDLGYLTSLYLGLELRLIEELPYRLQPFLLWDVAKLGNKRYAFDKPIFLSEGIGIRWASPFGTLRATAAKGRIWNHDISTQDYPEHMVYFISFGQEF